MITTLTNVIATSPRPEGASSGFRPCFLGRRGRRSKQRPYQRLDWLVRIILLRRTYVNVAGVFGQPRSQRSPYVTGKDEHFLNVSAPTHAQHGARETGLEPQPQTGGEPIVVHRPEDRAFHRCRPCGCVKTDDLQVNSSSQSVLIARIADPAEGRRRSESPMPCFRLARASRAGSSTPQGMDVCAEGSRMQRRRDGTRCA
jgi:hypothetical protein